MSQFIIILNQVTYYFARLGCVLNLEKYKRLLFSLKSFTFSLVSAVGTRSKKVGYGSNRADFSFIAGGIVPGLLILGQNLFTCLKLLKVLLTNNNRSIQ